MVTDVSAMLVEMMILVTPSGGRLNTACCSSLDREEWRGDTAHPQHTCITHTHTHTINTHTHTHATCTQTHTNTHTHTHKTYTQTHPHTHTQTHTHTHTHTRNIHSD